MHKTSSAEINTASTSMINISSLHGDLTLMDNWVLEINSISINLNELRTLILMKVIMLSKYQEVSIIP